MVKKLLIWIIALFLISSAYADIDTGIKRCVSFKPEDVNFANTTVQDRANSSLNHTFDVASVTATGKFGNAFTYVSNHPTTTDYVNLSKLDVGDTWSVSLFFNRQGTLCDNNEDYLFGTGGSDPYYYFQISDPLARQRARLDAGNDIDKKEAETSFCQTTNFIHVVAQYNTTVLEAELYVDGIKVTYDSNTDSGTGFSMTIPPDALLIGSNYGGGTGFTGNFDGVIDEFVVRTGWWTASEVLELNESGSCDYILGVSPPPSTSNASVSNVVLTSNLNNRTGSNLTLTWVTTVANSTYGYNITDWRINGTSIMVLNMPFERDGDQNATDYSTYGNNGTVTGATYNPTGGFDGSGAYDFDGTNNKYISRTYTGWSRTERSVSLWMKTEEEGNLGRMIGAGTSGNEYSLRLSTNKLQALIGRDGGGVVASSLGTRIFSVGRWYFISMVFDNNTNSLKTYIDGTIETSNTPSTYLDDSNTLLIGVATTATAEEFNGTIDQVQIFNRALSSEQILQLYRNRTDLIVSQETNIGENWTACITPNDGTIDGTQVCSNIIWIVDTIPPTITTNFENQSFYMHNNISAQFNFTDNLMLFSYNITLDTTTQIANKSGLTTNSFQYNFSYDTETLTKGKHTINVRVADGHTSNIIQDFKVSNGLFNSYLRYRWDDKYVRIEKKGGGIFEDLFDTLFDNFETTKLTDRYTWTYEPWDEKSIQVFSVKSDNQIYIINKPESKYKQWIIFDDKWMDFVLKDESPTINISRIAWNEVEVTVSNIKNPKTQLYNSIGELNIVTRNYTFYKLNASVEYNPLVVEGALNTLTLTLNSSSLNEFNISTVLNWASTSKGTGIRTNISNESIQFENAFNTPTIPQTLVNWTWYFNVSNYNFSLSGNQTYISINLTACTPGDYVILNFTLKDEETLVKASNISNASIKTDITLTSILNTSMVWNLTSTWNFSLSSNNQPELLVCLSNETLNASSFRLDALTEYSFASHVIEHNYITNFILSGATIPKITSLYDLATADSTSFLINYQNENYVYVEGAIVDVLRKYIGEGLFRSVEHAKTDESGQTRVHLVTEDIIYKFNVYLNGILEYSTPEYLALCQAVPCVINLRKPYDYNDSYILINDNLIYDMDISGRDATFSFVTKDGTTTEINMTIVEFSAYDNETVASQVVTSNAGSIILSVPIGYGNQSFTAYVFQDGIFIGLKTFSLAQTPYDIFGYTGIVMSALGFMTLALMGLSSGVATIFFGIIGLVLMTVMTLFSGGNIFGLGSSLIWLVVAGLIIAFKLEQRRNR